MLVNSLDRKKGLQELTLLKILFQEGALTINDIKAKLDLSQPSVNALTSDLILREVLMKKGKIVSANGRRPEVFDLVPDTYEVICVSMERFSFRITVINNNEEVLIPIKTIVFKLEDENAWDLISEEILLILSNPEIDSDKIVGIGFSMPGLVDSVNGNNLSYFKEKDGLSITAYYASRFSLPVYIMNDVKTITYAELKSGLLKKSKNALVLLMDWGVGLGIVQNGALQIGNNGFSGEIGHIPFVDNGELCYCGKRGCLETIASGIAMAKMAKDGIRSGQISLLNQLSEKEIDKIEPQLIIDAANKGDQYAITILSEIGLSMGKAIATLIQIFNPEKIILGGKITEAQQNIILPMRYSLNKYCMSQISENVQIELSPIGENATLFGISAYVINCMFDAKIIALEGK